MNMHASNATGTNVANQLVRQAHRTISAWCQADIGGNNFRCDLLTSRLKSIESEVSWHQAGRPEAALFQLCVALSVADDIRDEAARHGDSDVSVKYAQLERLLGSVIRFVEKETGAHREDWGLGYYHTDSNEASAWGIAEDAA